MTYGWGGERNEILQVWNKFYKYSWLNGRSREVKPHYSGTFQHHKEGMIVKYIFTLHSCHCAFTKDLCACMGNSLGRTSG